MKAMLREGENMHHFKCTMSQQCSKKKHAIPLLQMQAFKENNKMQRRIQENIGDQTRKRNHSKLNSWENDLKDQMGWCTDL
jgi:hypothetical protein